MKAIAIIAVVVTHAGPSPWLPGASAFDQVVRGSLAVFHVPSFLLLAGFLYAAHPVLSTPDLSRRMQRLLVPYVVASVVVLTLGFAQPATRTEALFMLVTGSSLGIYYFVFLLAESVTLTYLMTHLSPRAPCLALGAAFGWWLLKPLLTASPPTRGLPSFWSFRDPLWFGAYFFVGWNVRRRWGRVRRLLESYRTPLTILAALVCLIHVSIWPDTRTTYLDPFARGAYVLSVVGLIISATQNARVLPVVRFLSEASYTVYLYHSLFITAASPFVSSLDAPLRTLTLTSVGLLGSSALVYLGRRTLGGASRLTLGS